MIETYVCPSCEQNIEWDDSSEEEFLECKNCGDKLRSPNAPMLPKGTVIGDYVIEKRVGVGGMGEVYLAEQKSMIRPVALKVLQQDLVEDKSYLERFYREVRTLAQIEHPNIVKAIETGYQDNICYFSMSYIKGNDLKHKLDTEGKMSEIDALNVILCVARALKYVWERHKIIHRDIKPANIILTKENEVKLMDLGISKTVAEDKPADLTLAGMMVGSPYYVSPEQARAEKNIDWRADQYSLGASFYHMIVGELPYDSENAMTIIAAHLSKPIPDPRDKNPEITDRSANIIGQMMQKERDDRFASWDDAILAIEDAIEDLSDSGASTTILTALPEEIKQKMQVNLKKKKPLNKKKYRASPDKIDKVKEFAIKNIFGNLYIRFIVLVILLFFTFLAFFKLVKNSINEAKANKAKEIKEVYLNYTDNTNLRTEQEIKKAEAFLTKIQKMGNKKDSVWAAKEIKKIHKLEKEDNEDDKKLIKNALQKKFLELKRRIRKLVEKERIDTAITELKAHLNSDLFSSNPQYMERMREILSDLKEKKMQEKVIQ